MTTSGTVRARLAGAGRVAWEGLGTGRRAVQAASITRILRRPEPPRPYDDLDLFERLCRAYPPRTAYRYDSWSLWERGTRRARGLLTRMDLRQPGADVLEAGCGDGMTGHALHGYGHAVTLTDLEDWRDARAEALPFVQGDLCAGLDVPEDAYDLVFSYNTFEHVPDPAAALAELVRVCRPGGRIFLRFGPLFASAWGLHAYRTIPIPYAQYLFSPAFLQARLAEVGVHDLGREREDLQPLNRWRLAAFDRQWQRGDCVLLERSSREDAAHVSLVRRYPDAFQGRGLTYDDLVTKNLEVVLRKAA